MWDVGGQDKLRPLWRSYTRCTDGIIFVVDSTKVDRLEEAKLELLKICKTHKQSQIPVLILANKQDLPVAIDADKVEASLGLKELGPSAPWHLQATCAVTGKLNKQKKIDHWKGKKEPKIFAIWCQFPEEGIDTPPIAETICVKHVGANVVCGFLMK